MTDAAGIAQWIHDLAGSDERARIESAMRLYLAGVSLCTPLLSRWVSDPEFRELTLPGRPTGEAHARPQPSAIIVGIAVRPETFQHIRAANNSPRLADVPADQDALEFELHLDASLEFDILTTREPGGPARFHATCKSSVKASSRSKFTSAMWIAQRKFCARDSRSRRSIPPPAREPTARVSISSSPPPPTRKKF